MDENMGFKDIDFSAFDENQKLQIRFGVENGLDVSRYTQLDDAGRPVYDYRQMGQIQHGLLNGLDVNLYTVLDEAGKPVFDNFQMGEIRYGLEENLDVSKYADPGLDWRQMRSKRWDLMSATQVPEKGVSLKDESKDAKGAAQALSDEGRDAPCIEQGR